MSVFFSFLRVAMENQKNAWTLIIKPNPGWFQLGLGDIWRYRDLVVLFVKRDFVAIYKQTILGPLWFVFQPLLTIIMYSLVFGRLAGIPTEGLPPMLYYMGGLAAWNYFADCLNKSSNTFVNNAALFGKVYFPRLVVPISIVLSNLISFFIQILFLICFMGFFAWQGKFHFIVQPQLMLLPLLVLIMSSLGLGLGILISSLTTKYRDLRYVVTFGVQLLFYGTPVIYSMGFVPPAFRFWINLNPMSPVIEAFKYVFLGVGSWNWMGLGYAALVAAFVLAFGVLIFNRVEKSFSDTV